MKRGVVNSPPVIRIWTARPAKPGLPDTASALDRRSQACVIGLQNAKGLELLVLDAETMTDQLLAPLQPNERALTPLFQANFDEGMLREIAEADYGESANECYALLQPILKTGLVESYDSMLNEVLHLISFSEPRHRILVLAARDGGSLDEAVQLKSIMSNLLP